MSTPFNQLPGPTVCVSPWTTVDRVLYVDLKAFLASVRYNRNVLSTRIAVKSQTNVAIDETFVLPAMPKDKPSAKRKLDFVSGNQATIVSTNRPVHLVVTRESGTMDMGLQTLFVITNSIIALEFENSQNLADVEINVVTV